MSPAPALASSLQLASGEVHVWSAGLDVPPGTFDYLHATLASDERHRGARFRFEHDRCRFVVARGTLRDLLGRYLQTRPGRISLVYNAFGKPELSPEYGSRLTFNLSHSADLVLVAIAVGANVGVDLEYTRPQSDYAEIARHFFSAAEVDHFNALPGHLHEEAFFDCWTRKEAYLKARGEGLAIPLNSFSVPLATGRAHLPAGRSVGANRIVPARRWSFHSLRPAPGYIGALAIEATGRRVSQWQWRAPRGAGAQGSTPMSSRRGTSCRSSVAPA